MLQSRIAGTEFHISLDDMDLDLNFLKHYIQRTPDETRQLWSKSFMDRGSEFNHVAIVSEKIEDEDYCLELYETYLCYICNIEVPQTCYKNHIKSRKHQIYKKLTEKVLENVTKQIKVDVDNIHNKVEDTSYYCETCSKLVSVKDQRKHHLSSYHLKSIENEKLVANFFEMYTDDIKIVKNNIKKDLNETVSEYYSVYNTDGSGDDDEEFELEKCYNTTSIALKNSTHTLHEDSILISSSKSEESVDASPIKMPNFELYLKEMIAKYKLNFNIPTIENNCVLVSTPKGYNEKVTVDTFHGYKKINSFLFCQLCSRWLNEKTEQQQHNATEQHVRNIIRPVNDNFERVTNQIDSSGNIVDTRWSHCLICNEIVLTGSNHADRSPNHSKYNHPNIIQSKKTAILPEKTFCSICCISIDTHNFLAHTKGLKHKLNSKTMLTTNNILNVTELKTSSVDPIKVNTTVNIKSNKMPVKSKKTYCDICNIHIDTHNFIGHTKAQKHMQKLKQESSKTNLLKTNSDITQMTQQLNKTISSVGDDNITLNNFCNVCQVNVPNGGMAIHIQGKAHKNKSCNVIKNLSNTNLPTDKNIPSTSNSALGLDIATRKKLKVRKRNQKVANND